jgi:hypothetical protein
MDFLNWRHTGESAHPAFFRDFSGISTRKRARVQWGDLPIWTMLFVSVIGGRLHDKEQADAQSSPQTAAP